MGNRVIVLTARPGSIKTIISLTFPTEYNTPLLRRETVEFNHYFQTIWKELNEHA